MILYFNTKDSKIAIKKKPLPDYTSTAIEVEFEKGVKDAIKDFEVAYNLDDEICRQLHLGLIVLRFSSLKGKNKKVWEFILFSWAKSLKIVHDAVFDETEDKPSKKLSINKKKLKRS